MAGQRAYADDYADGRACAAAIRAEERRRDYPVDLLFAIALVESGRYDERRRADTPWPWTVTAGGRGRFFSTQAAAAAAIRGLRAEGIESIDVGCMQVNLYYHAEAFASVEDALDPAHNVAYAASFLTDLAARTGSWLAAVGRYHSGTDDNAQRYRMKVLAARDARRRHARRRPEATASTGPVADDARVHEAPAGPDLPTVLRGSKQTLAPARIFAPGRIVLPIILRGKRGRDGGR